MRRSLVLLRAFLLSWCALAPPLMAQAGEVRGVVRDARGWPVQGARIRVEGGVGNGAVTGADGRLGVTRRTE